MPFRELGPTLLTLSAAGAAVPPDHRRAAVAAVLRLGDGPEVLLMQRSERAEDLWSGHVSLPGGHEDGSEGLVATAVRETREEVGLDLARDAELLGALPPIQARARGRMIATTVVPLVFAETTPREPHLGAEAASVFWFPLRRALGGELDQPLVTEGRELPSWRFDGRVVWGLTHRILSELLKRAEPVLPT